MTKGFILSITDDVVKNLEAADKAVKEIGTNSEKARDMVNNAFQKMATGGVQEFINKLNEVKQQLSEVGNIKSSNSIGTISVQATESADAVNNLINSISKLVQVAKGEKAIQPVDIDSLNTVEQKVNTLRHLIAEQETFFRNHIDTLSRESLDEQRYQHQMSLMKEYYTEEAKLAVAAEKEAERRRIAAEKEAERRRIAWEKEAAAWEKAQEKSRIAAKKALADWEEEHKKSYDGSLVNAAFADSIEKQIRAIGYLKAARDKLSSGDIGKKEYREKIRILNEEIKRLTNNINILTNGNNELGNSQRSLINTAEQLKRAFSLLFSVSAIKGYINKIIQARGEFELQGRSLEAILQNKDAADKLLAQVIDLSVRSPFGATQLITYTKQLAAYRVETEKLYDTTTMLADVSAGLGVDMNRLILAYGQVKAANYLRGTELRQFSEAGINVLGELSKYFSELENRAVTVGEVFDRVSKRMVSFANVEEVFKRVTSEGGIFYKMQETQAETLKGMVTNLKDAIDIMLSDIGKDNDGVLKGIVSTIREIILNWREVAFVLKTIIALYGAYKIPAALVAYGNSDIAKSLLSITTHARPARTALDLLRSAARGFATLGLGAVVAAIATVLIHLARTATKARRELKRLNEELAQIYRADTSELTKQVNGFKDLVNRLKSVNKGSKEHKDIIGALNQNYGEYLGFVVKESTTYEQMAKSIDKVNISLTNKAKLNTFEKAFSKSFEKTNELIDSYQKSIKELVEHPEWKFKKDGLNIIPTEKELNDIFYLFEKKVKEAKPGTPYFNIVMDAFKEYGVQINTVAASFGAWVNYGNVVIEQQKKELELERKINNLYGGKTAKTIEMRQQLEKLNMAEEADLQKATSRREKEQVRLKYAIDRINAEIEYEGLGEKEAEKRIEALQQKSATIIDINEKIQASVDELGASYADMIYIDDEQAVQGLEEIAKSAAEGYNMQNSIIKSQNQLKEAGTVYDQTILEDAEKSAKAYEFLLTLLGRRDLLQKAHQKEENKGLTLLNKQITAIKNAHQLYNKLKQTRKEDVAAQDVKIAYKPLFEELGISNILESMGLDESGIVEALDLLPQIAGAKGKEAIEKVQAEFKGEIALDLEIVALKDLQREIDQKFENYQLYLELKGIGLSDDVIRTFYADIVDFSQLKEWANKMSNNLLDYGDKGIEANKNMNEKILKMEREYAKERVKTYVKYLMEAQREAVKIKVEELRKLKEIEESKEFSPEQKQEIKDRVRKETNADLQKQEWADFQNTEMYTMMFEDLEHYGTQALETLRDKLEELKGSLTDLPANEVKEIINQLSKIEDITIERNPFRALKDARDKIIKEGISEETAQTNLAQSENEIAKLQSELDIINIVNTAKSKGLAIDKETQYAYDDIVAEVEDMGVAEADIVEHKEKSLKAEKENAQAAKKTLDIYERQGKARIAALNKTKNILGSVQDATKASVELMDSLGVSSDSIGYTLAESTDGMISLTLSAIEFSIQMETLGYQSNMALGIIGWIAIGIQAVATAISAIFKMQDAGLQNQIDKLAEQTEDLQEKFETLEAAVDKAYSTDTLKQASKDAEKYTKQMIVNYKAMIELEKQKKKTDEEKIKEYEESIAAQREALEDLKQDMLESMGGVTDYRSATQDFVDAWVEAYKECGDGLNGLQDNFTEFFDNLIKQQATMKVTEKFLEPFYDNLNLYLEDYELTKDEMDKLREQAKNIAPELSKYLEELWNILGGSMGETGGSLSGLQAGIQGITESQAEIISAYLNSIRFFVSDNNSVMKQLRDYVIGTEENANPMLAQLRIIAKQTASISELLNSVTATNNDGAGQRGIRVYMPA